MLRASRQRCPLCHTYTPSHHVHLHNTRTECPHGRGECRVKVMALVSCVELSGRASPRHNCRRPGPSRPWPHSHIRGREMLPPVLIAVQSAAYHGGGTARLFHGLLCIPFGGPTFAPHLPLIPCPYTTPHTAAALTMLMAAGSAVRRRLLPVVAGLPRVRLPIMSQQSCRAFANDSASKKDDEATTKVPIHPANANPFPTAGAHAGKPDFDLIVIGSGPG